MARRMPRGIAAGAPVAAVVAFAAAAAAQVEMPVFAGVTVTPTVLSAPGAITVAGPGTPGGEGCRAGEIRAALPGQLPSQGRLFARDDLDSDWSIRRSEFEDAPFAAGTYTIFIDCNDLRGNTILYATNRTFTIEATATTTSTASTSTTTTSGTTQTTGGPTGTAGTVDPTKAKPGQTTITIRGGGFRPGATLQISLATSPVTALGSTTASATGAYAATLQIPVTAPPGVHRLLVTGPGPGTGEATRSTTATLTVEDLNCPDFTTPEAAQAALGNGDPHGLDGDQDGLACESGSNGEAGSAAADAGGTVSGPGGSLPATGSRHTMFGLTAGLVSVTFGALLMGLSHPAAPATAADRRRRRGAHFR